MWRVRLLDLVLQLRARQSCYYRVEGTMAAGWTAEETEALISKTIVMVHTGTRTRGTQRTRPVKQCRRPLFPERFRLLIY